LDRYIRYYHRTIKDYPRSKFNIETGLAAVEAGLRLGWERGSLLRGRLIGRQLNRKRPNCGRHKQNSTARPAHTATSSL
jgi:hypothetical protein